jgi:hypothetical protein
MGVSFDWDERNERQAEPPGSPRARLRRWARRLLLLLLLGALLWGGVMLVRMLARPSPAELQRALDLVHATEARAVALGDHALFTSLQDEDPAWRAAQYTQIATHPPASLTVVQAGQQGDRVRAWHRWRADGVPLQRVAFYQWFDQRLRHVADDPTFWGTPATLTAEWGTLTYDAADRAFAADIQAHIAQRVAELCAQPCVPRDGPLAVTLASDAALVAADGGVSVPSPHLLGLTADGVPGAPFHHELDRRLVDALLPATIRFAVPDALVGQTAPIAAQFSRDVPHISVEVVPFSQLPPDPAARLAQVDAALLTPSPALITAGHVHDLTDLAAADGTFATDDLYAVARDAAHWQERLWMAPQFVEFRLIHADRAAFSIGVLTADQYLARIWQPPVSTLTAQTRSARTDGLGAGYLDISTDSLFAYAFDQRCAGAETTPCRAPLRREDVAAALTWYAHQVADGIMPDVSALTDEERQFILLNSLAYPRQLPMWAGQPGQYEHNSQLGPVDASAFAGSDGRGITPFTVTGSVISASTPRPRAAWAWISYLSRARPMGSARALPVFTTTAEEIGYWDNLPESLRPAVQTALSRGRGVGIAEADLFAWLDVAAVVAGTQSADAAADAMMSPAWFGAR